MKHVMIKGLVRMIIERPGNFEWTIQGFGMLRCYLPGIDNIRMHIWDSRHRTAKVSDLHTHPWNFESLVVAGELENKRYQEAPAEVYPENDPHFHWKQPIHCGIGGCIVGEKQKTFLILQARNNIKEGQSYYQSYDEIHRNIPEDGTIAVVKRVVPERRSVDMAYVYWEDGEEWITAEPRAATTQEIMDITSAGLHSWF